MNDAAEEERLLRAITRKPPPQGPTKTVSARPVDVTTTAPKVVSSRPQEPKVISQRPPETTSAPKVVSSRPQEPKVVSGNSNSYAEQIEILHSKKSSVASSIVTNRRELEEVRAEIEKLKSKENDLMVLLEKREHATKKLTEEIEKLERAAKEHAEDLKRKDEKKKEDKKKEEGKKKEEDKKKVEDKKKEEGKKKEEDKKKEIEADELKRRPSNPSTHFTPSYPQSDATSRVLENTQGSLSNSFMQGRASSVRSFTPRDATEEGLSPEEARLIRAMNRKSLVPGAPIKAQTVKAPESKPQPVHEPLWKEQERAREAERAARLAEENRKKEEVRRATLDREAEARKVEENRVSAIQSREGHLHTFVSPIIYDFDAEVKICGDFTDWREIPLTTPLNDNFTYSITLPLSPGPHFYRFKTDGKWELNKNQLTGVAPTGEVMNKIEI